MNQLIMETRGLSKIFFKRTFFGSHSGVHAVNDVNLKILRGESLGIVGESGCGKSTLARILMGLEKPTAGEIYFKGELRPPLKGKARLDYYAQVQFVFQDPLSSLNPRKTVQQILDVPLKTILGLPRQERERRIRELMEAVSLREEFLNRHPHEFSGGQSQRIGVARALAASPDVCILDEPVSALDVSVQAQIIQLLKDLKQQFDLTYLFISHDLAVVEKLCDTLAVMYLGRIVEYGPSRTIFDNPLHPYTRLLLTSVPEAGKKLANDVVLSGEPPDPSNPPPGCAFAPRCPYVQPQCTTEVPDLEEVDGGRRSACPVENSRFRGRS